MNDKKQTEPVLVVDDHPRSSEIVGRLLVRQGYRVSFAASGEEAMHALAEEPFAAVISDIEMPGMNGLELLQNVHLRYPQTPVILMTAFYSDELRDSALAWGASALLKKPFSGEQLAGAIRSAQRQSETAAPLPALAQRHG
jgi:CheY-like chemotaxis protein